MSTDDGAEMVQRWFDELFRQVSDNDVSFYEAAGYMPDSALAIAIGTPGRMGWTFDHRARIAPNDPGVASDDPVTANVVRALASAVLALTERLGVNQPEARWQDVAYHWLQLRAVILGAVAPGRVYPQWISNLLQQARYMGDSNPEERLVTALERGNHVFASIRGQSDWRRDSWEESVSTEQIIEWFRTACFEVRHRLAAGE